VKAHETIEGGRTQPIISRESWFLNLEAPDSATLGKAFLDIGMEEKIMEMGFISNRTPQMEHMVGKVRNVSRVSHPKEVVLALAEGIATQAKEDGVVHTSAVSYLTDYIMKSYDRVRILHWYLRVVNKRMEGKD
jgi:hypothetical protein